MEFVADQLRRVKWVSGYTFVEPDGYHLDWSEEGTRRMMLLQIALKNCRSTAQGLHHLPTDDEESQAITDFWEACVAQLALSGQPDALPALARIIESWQPRS